MDTNFNAIYILNYLEQKSFENSGSFKFVHPQLQRTCHYFVNQYVVVVTFRHQAEGIAPIEVLVLIPLFSAIGAITENGPCTHYSFVEVQHQTVPQE